MKKKFADEIGKVFVRLCCSHWYWRRESPFEVGSFCRGVIVCNNCGARMFEQRESEVGMKEEEIREGDIVEIDYIAEFTKEHINEGKALVILRGHNHQPLVRKLSTKNTIWTCYEHIARVIGHIDIEKYMDEVLNTAEIKPQEREDKE